MARYDLEELHAELGSWPDVAAFLEMELEERGEEDTERAPMLVTLASVHQVHLNDNARAVELLEQAVDLDIENAVACDSLVDLYRQTGDFQSASALLLDRLDVVQGRDARLAILFEAAEMYATAMGQPEGAVLLLQKAAAEFPESDEVHQRLLDLATTPDQAEPIADFYTGLVLRVAEERGERATVALQVVVGMLHLGPLARPEMAQIYFEKALTLNDKHVGALQALEGIYREEEDWEALSETLERRVALTDDSEEELDLLAELATIYGVHLDNAPKAAACLERRVELGDQSSGTLDLVQGLYERLEDWNSLSRLLARRLESTQDTEEDTNEESAPARGAARVQLLCKLGELRALRLQDNAGAMRAYREAFEHDAGCTQAIAFLEDQYRNQQRWDAYLEILNARLVLPMERDERARVQRARAETIAKTDGPREDVITAYEAAYADDSKDEDVFNALRKLYKDEDRLNDLADLHHGRGHDTNLTQEQRSAGYLDAAKAYLRMEKLADAVACWQSMVDLGWASTDTIRELADGYTSLGKHDRAIQTLEHLQAGANAEAQIASLLAIAAIQREQDHRDYPKSLRAVLELQPDHREAIDALIAHFEEKESWQNLFEALTHATKVERDLKRRAELHTHVGRVLQDEMSDSAGALHHFEVAYELDPLNPFAAAPLAEVAMEEERWERVPPLLKVLLEDDRFDSSAETHAYLHRQIANAYVKLASDEEAVGHLETAQELVAGDASELSELAGAYARAGRHADAVRIFTSLIDEHALLMSEKEQVALYNSAGAAHANVGNVDGALNAYRATLEVDPYNEDALKAMSELGSDSNTDGLEQIRTKQRLLQLTIDPLERFKLTVEIGDAFAALDDVPGAVEAYRAAIEIDADSKVVLSKLLNLFMKSEQWRRAAEVLGKLAALETKPERKNQLLFTVAALFRDELDDRDQATTFFEMVLDADPTRIDAFEAIDHMYSKAGDYAPLERAYRKMLERTQRLEGELAENLTFKLVTNLGRIYLEKLGDPDQALAAYQVASRLRPNDAEILEKITQIYPRQGKSDEDTIEQHRALLLLKPDRIDSYHILFSTFHRRREFDRAWRIAGVLETFSNADANEARFYREVKPRGLPLAKRPLGENEWRNLYHAGLDFLLTRMFSLIGRYVGPAFSGDLKALGIHRKKDAIDMAHQHPSIQMLSYVARTMGVGSLEFFMSQQPLGFRNPNTAKRSLVLGADILGAQPDRRLLFQMGRQLTLMRDEFYLAAAFPNSDSLKAFVYGTIAVFTGRTVPDPSAEAVTQIAEVVRKQPQDVINALGNCVQGFLDSGASPDVSRWLRAVELTANRAGLLLACDLKGSVQAARDAISLGKATREDMLKDLVLYSISDAYEDVRASLGLAIGQQ